MSNNPFVRLDCGCIVIPTDRRGSIQDSVDCIFVYACDSVEDGFGFHFRSIEKAKLAKAEPLSASDANAVVQRISVRISLGRAMVEINHNLSWAQRMAKDL